jgi:broad specificity phosphatase PhoE
VHFDRVITSPLSRASVTGKAIADAIGCTDFSTDDRIIERDFGELSGKPYEFSAPYIVGDADYVKGLEPVCSVLERVDSFIKEVVKPNTNIIAVTHGSVSGVFASRSKKRDGVDPTGKILHNCHMVVYSYDGNEIIMEGYDISPREIGSLDLQ